MKKMKARTLRTIVTFVVLAVVAVGYFTAWGIGNLSGFGWDAFSVLCPLGYLESLVASKTFVPRAFLSFVLVIVAIVLLGRVFCAWICPMPTLQRLIPGVKRGRGKRAAKVSADDDLAKAGALSGGLATTDSASLASAVDKQVKSEGAAAFGAAEGASGEGNLETSCNSGKTGQEIELSEPLRASTPVNVQDLELSESDLPANGVDEAKKGTFRTVSAASGFGKLENLSETEAPSTEQVTGARRVKFDSRFGVLLGALASAAIFGFPVFCLICPVGLTFATVLLVMRLFAFGDVTWAVVAAPLVLLAEVVFLRKWCGKFCPLGALISLVSGANRTLRPHVDNASCLFTSKGKKCFACSKACPEHIDVRRPELSESAAMNCTKCRECADACPAHAITFPVLPKGGQAQAVKRAKQGESKEQ